MNFGNFTKSVGNSVMGALDDVDKKADETGEALHQTGNTIDQAATDSAAAIDQTSKDAGSAIDKTVKDAGSTIDQGAITAGSAIDKTVKDAGSAIDQEANTAGSAIDKTVEDAGSTIDQEAITAGSAIDQKAKEASSVIGEKAKASGEAVQEEASGQPSFLDNAFGQISDGAKEKVGEIVEGVKVKASGALQSFTGSGDNNTSNETKPDTKTTALATESSETKDKEGFDIKETISSGISSFF